MIGGDLRAVKSVRHHSGRIAYTPSCSTKSDRQGGTGIAATVRYGAPLRGFLLSGLAFLPVIGIELLPLGLLLIAEDVPFLRGPAARLMLWLEDRWRALRRWWRHKKGVS